MKKVFYSTTVTHPISKIKQIKGLYEEFCQKKENSETVYYYERNKFLSYFMKNKLNWKKRLEQLCSDKVIVVYTKTRYTIIITFFNKDDFKILENILDECFKDKVEPVSLLLNLSEMKKEVKYGDPYTCYKSYRKDLEYCLKLFLKDEFYIDYCYTKKRKSNASRPDYWIDTRIYSSEPEILSELKIRFGI